MLLSFDILPEIFLFAILFGSVYWLFYRPYIYSIADPIFIFIFTTTFGSVLVVEALEETKFIYHYFICQAFLYAGFAIVQKKTGNPAINTKNFHTHFYDDAKLLRYIIYSLLIIYFLSNLIIFYTKGFALLSDNPSTVKETNFRGGFGIFRKIGWAVGGVVSSGLTFLFLKELRWQDLALLLVMMFITSLEGSKGALVRYIICFGQFIVHPAFANKAVLLKWVRRFAPLGLVSVFLIFFTVLLKENNTTEEVMLAFARRLLYGADAVLYFYHPVNIDYFNRFSILDFPSYLINPILGFLRLASYQEAFGNIMVDNVMPIGVTLDVIVGPNSSFYTEGQVFFGYYGAFVYSFVIGALTSFLRSLFFSVTRTSTFFLVYLSTIAQFSAGFLVDVKTTITQIFDTVILVLPIYVLVCLIFERRLVIWRFCFKIRSSGSSIIPLIK